MSGEGRSDPGHVAAERNGSAFEIDSCHAQRNAIKAGKIAFRGLTHGHYPGIKLPARLLPGLRSLGFWDAVGVQDWGMEPHRNDGLEIVLLETGRMEFTVDDSQHSLSAGSLTVTRPWQRHCHGSSQVGPGRLHWLILDVEAMRAGKKWRWPEWIALCPADMRALTNRLRKDYPCVMPASHEIIASFQRMAACLAHPHPRRQVSQLIISINQLLLSLLAEMASLRDRLLRMTARPGTPSSDSCGSSLEILRCFPRCGRSKKWPGTVAWVAR